MQLILWIVCQKSFKIKLLHLKTISYFSYFFIPVQPSTLKKVFPICSTYTSNIPTYPGGYWAWAFCSEEVEPLSYFAKERANKITKSCKIYNEDYHNARFALPNYLKELL